MEGAMIGLFAWFGLGAFFIWAAVKSWTLRWGSPPEPGLWILALCGPATLGCLLAEITIRLTADDYSRSLWERARKQQADLLKGTEA